MQRVDLAAGVTGELLEFSQPNIYCLTIGRYRNCILSESELNVCIGGNRVMEGINFNAAVLFTKCLH